jgi:hypothetical protein
VYLGFFNKHGWTYHRRKKNPTLCKHRFPCNTLTHSINEDLNIKRKGDPEVIFWAEIYWGRLFFRAESSLIQLSCRSFIGVIVPYEISKVNFHVETKFLIIWLELTLFDLWLFRSFYLCRSSAESLVERDFLLIYNYRTRYQMHWDSNILKDEVLLTVGCTIFPMYLFIAKYLFIGSFKNRSIDI